MTAWLLAALAACRAPPTEGMVRIERADGGAFWIDRFEYPNRPDEMPEHTLDLATARELCAREGKRLCTAAEWRRACLGPEGRNRYGYGPRFVSGACHVEVRLPSGHTSMLDADAMVAASGAYLDCRTPEGVYDLVGNLEEWVLDDWRGVGGMLEGGAWYTEHTYADCTGRYSREPDYRLAPDQPVFSAGLRCCWSEEAPTEDALDPAELHADAARRLEEARARASAAPYRPDDEVEVLPGLFVDRFEYPNRAGEFPLVGVTWSDAAERCAAAGKRLCTAWEWERACAGAEDLPLPYGDRTVPGACAVALEGPAPAGRHLACATAEGVRDLVGSAWEWTATRLDAPGLAVRPGEVLREVRGGSWFTEERKAACRPVDGYPAAPEDVPFPDVGFRCCRGPVRDPETAAPEPPRVRCPEGMVAVGDTCIDRWEAPSRRGELPRGGLDWAGAQALCRSLGKRVCTEEEWERACAGRAGRRWPYGNEFDPERCHLEERPHRVLRGGAAPAEGGPAPFGPAGAHPGCATPEGVEDLSGNLWEWVRAADGRGVLRGGGWNLATGLGQCRARAEAADGFDAAELGVRCCADGAPLDGG